MYNVQRGCIQYERSTCLRRIDLGKPVKQDFTVDVTGASNSLASLITHSALAWCLVDLVLCGYMPRWATADSLIPGLLSEPCSDNVHGGVNAPHPLLLLRKL